MNNNAAAELAKRLPTLRDSLMGGEIRTRVERAKNDFEFFCKTYLERYFSCEMADYQKILIKIAQERRLTEDLLSDLLPYVPGDFRESLYPMDPMEGMANVEPRGHGKSTRWTFAFPLWLTLTGRSHFCVIVGSDKKSAISQLTSIKTEIEVNDLLIQDFGDQKGKEWQADNILLKNGARIRAYGKGSAMRGTKNRESRPDYLIIDDVFKDQEANSQDARDKVSAWFNKTVLPIGQLNTFFVMVNTITHNDDLISNTLKKIEKKEMPGWIGIRLAAEIGEGRPLWPQRYSWQYLKQMERKIGSVSYAQEYMSRALSEEDRLFRKEWIVYANDADVPRSAVCFEGIDPATGAHDMSAVVDVAYCKDDGKIYVLGSHGKKESPEKFKERLFTRYRYYDYKRAYMENVAFQNVFKQEIVRDGMKRGLSLPIKGVAPGRGSKSQRNMMLSPMIENGSIVFCKGNDALIDQLLDFPTGRYDDLVDALYYAVAAVGIKGFSSSQFRGRQGVKDLKTLRRLLDL